jgi:tetratricopeptide (TPR) repeat protein
VAPVDAREVMKPDGPAQTVDAFYRNVWGYHAMNLAIHLAAALFLFGVVRRTLEAPRMPDPFRSAATILAFVVALLWAVHPLTTSAVTYVVQRVESLMALFYLLTLYCAIRALQPGGSRVWVMAATISCVLGMGTKESMVTAPLMVWSWDRLLGAPTGGRRRWLTYASLASTWLILAYLVSLDARPSTVGAGRGGWTSLVYLQTQIQVVSHYLRLAVVPTPLVLDYRWPPVYSFTSVLPQALVLITALAITVMGFHRKRPEALIGVWVFGILAPTSSVLPIATEVAAEHRMYLPLAGVVAAAVIGVYMLQSRCRRKWLLEAGTLKVANGLIVLVVGIVLVAATRARCEQYRSEEVLLGDTVQKRPDNANARIAYGGLMIRQGRFAEAETQMRAILVLGYAEPGVKANAHLLLGSALCAQSRLADGIEHLRLALRLDPTLNDAHALLGEAHSSVGEARAAAREFIEAARVSPNNPVIIRRVALFLSTSTDDQVRNGALAATLAERAVSLTGGRDPMSLEALATAYAELERFPDATAALREALALLEGSRNEAYYQELRTEIAMVEMKQKIRFPLGVQ